MKFSGSLNGDLGSLSLSERLQSDKTNAMDSDGNDANEDTIAEVDGVKQIAFTLKKKSKQQVWENYVKSNTLFAGFLL